MTDRRLPSERLPRHGAQALPALFSSVRPRSSAQVRHDVVHLPPMQHHRLPNSRRNCPVPPWPCVFCVRVRRLEFGHLFRRIRRAGGCQTKHLDAKGCATGAVCTQALCRAGRVSRHLNTLIEPRAHCDITYRYLRPLIARAHDRTHTHTHTGTQTPTHF